MKYLDTYIELYEESLRQELALYDGERVLDTEALHAAAAITRICREALVTCWQDGELRA